MTCGGRPPAGSGLYDTAFDPSLLTYFRRRLRHSADPTRIFTKVKEVVAATGVLKGKQRRALDSTVLDDAVATQDTVTQIISAIRRVIREVPGAGEVAAGHCPAHDYTDPGKPKIAWDDETARAALVDALVTDALNLLGHLPEQNLGEKAANAVGLLALVAGQDVEPAEDSDGRDGRWRIAKRTVADRTVSTVDPDARHIHKNRTRHQDGFKGHASFEPETGLFTAVALTSGYGPDNHEAAVAAGLLDGRGRRVNRARRFRLRHRRPARTLQADGHTLVIKPPPLRQAVPGGFTIDDFHIDPAAGTATCPAGHTANLGQVKQTAPAPPSSSASAPAAPCGSAAPPPRPDAPSTSTPSTNCWPPPAPRPPPTPAGRTSTAAGGHRSNAPSPGSSPRATAGSPTAASSPTTSGSTTAPPPSTSAD